MLKKTIAITAIVALFAVSAVVAQDNKPYDPARPWAGEFADSLPKTRQRPAPDVPLEIKMSDGSPIPMVISEDEPIELKIDSPIFDSEAPSKDNDIVLSSPQWTAKLPLISWYIVDYVTKKSVRAPSTPGLSPGYIVITPSTPTDKGVLGCFANRGMSYYDDSGQLNKTFAQASRAVSIVVKDITPPTCGFYIKLSNGKSGSCWPVEFPKDKFPLPKTANVYAMGNAFDVADGDFIDAPGIKLGTDMVLDESFSIEVEKDTVMEVSVIGGDNYKLEKTKTFFGVCAGGGGEPAAVYEANVSPIDFSKFKIPQNPFLFVDATDAAGNRQTMFVPIKVKE